MSFFFFLLEHFSHSRGEDGQQMYTRGSIIGAATTSDPDISSTPPLIFTGGGGQKVRFLALSLNNARILSRCGLETEQDIFTILKLGV